MKEIKADVFEIAWVDDGSDLQGSSPRFHSRVPHGA
jgi:hypothetical protein